jgi:hypothetical protein
MAQGLSFEIDGFKKEFGKALEGKDYSVDTRRSYAKYLEANSDGQITDPLKATDYAIAIQLKKQGIDFNKATESQKADALRQIIQNTYNEMNTQLNSYTNGRSLSQMEEELNNAGSAVFGNKHDIAFAVNDYISSQQEGGAAVNMAAKTAAAIAIAVATGGTGLAALGTAAVLTTAASAAIDLSDKMSSNVGLQDGEVETILKNATVDGACVFAGGMVGKFASVFKSTNSFVQAGGRLTIQLAGDATTGAAAEYVQTGTITLEGVTFNAVFSAAGNIISLKQAGQSVKQTTTTEVATKTPSPRATVKPKAKYPEDTVLGRISKNENPHSVGRLTDNNYASLKKDIETRLKAITSETELDALKKEIGKLEVRDQRRPLEQLIEAKRTELKTRPSTPKAKEVEPDSNSGQTTKAETSGATGENQVVKHDVDAALKKAPENIKQAYRKLSQEIENLTVETYTTIKNNIRTALNNSKELMNDLLEKLEAKYKSIKSTITGNIEIENPTIGKKLPTELRAGFSAESELRVRSLKSGERTIEKVGDKHYIIKNDNGELKLEGIIDNSEFTRVAGNNGKVIDERYIQNSLEAKNKILEAIDSGEYTGSVESYMKTINEAHKLSYEGKNVVHFLKWKVEK